jgi:polysaccharide biosynthesis protein VpsM
MNTKRTGMIILVLWLCLLAGRADAIGNIHFGPLEVHPFLSLKEEFSDNIYTTATDQKSDSITVTTPGVKALMPFSMHRVEAEYYAIDRRYGTYSGEDTTDHHASGLLDLRFGSLFSLAASGAFDKGHEPRGSSASGFIEVFRKNSGSASAIYQLANRSKVRLDYSTMSINFMTSNFRDRDESLASGYLYYRFLPKTSAFIEYDRKSVDFTPASTTLDNSMDTISLGITWEATARSKGTVKAGRTSKDFNDPSVKDFTDWSWSIDLDHKFTEATSMVLVGQREVNETNAVGVAYFTTTGAYAEFSHRFLSKMAFLLRGSYGKDLYSNAVPPETLKREDKTNMLGTGLKYFMQDWLEFGIDYNKRDRNSNIDANDYRETLYILSVSMMF